MQKEKVVKVLQPGLIDLTIGLDFEHLMSGKKIVNQVNLPFTILS